MLILARRIGESIMVGDQVEISVVDIKGDQVKLGIKAPAQVKVYRREVYAAIQQENLAAAAAAPQRLPTLEELMGPEKKPPAAQPPAGQSPQAPAAQSPQAPSAQPPAAQSPQAPSAQPPSPQRPEEPGASGSQPPASKPNRS